MTTLLQARSVLAWFRHLRSAGIEAGDVTLQVRPEADGLLDTIGGNTGEQLRARAVEVEQGVYRIITSLVAPPERDLPPEVVRSYRPFDFIDRIRIPGDGFGIAGFLDLVPLAIFDDAHVLHPDQFKALERFLVRRELHIARWMIARFDVLLPEEALAAVVEDRSATFPGLIAERESELILLQSSGKRRNQRERFRVLAKDMAGRYLRRMPLFSERNLTVLGNLLGDRDVALTPGNVKELESETSIAQTRLRVSDAQRASFEEQIRTYWGDKSSLPRDVSLRMLYVMMHRYDVRRRRSEPSLFADEEELDAEESIIVAANDAVYEAAIFQLFRQYNRPYYFGIDDVCDASSENAELFLHLSAELVEAVATQIARKNRAMLAPAMQDRLLRERASKITTDWSFPHDDSVRLLTEKIAERCLTKSLEPNGAVIANAFGIPQAEFDSLTQKHPSLSRVLQFAVAYNAITLVPYHSCKKKEWCLLELGGPVLLKHGLTLKRGGFIEGTASDLARFVAEATS